MFFQDTMKVINLELFNINGLINTLGWCIRKKSLEDFAFRVSFLLSILVSCPFTSESNRLRDHEKKVYHKNALIDAESFLRVYNQKQSTVEQQLVSAHQSQIQKNRKILASLIEIITFTKYWGIDMKVVVNYDQIHRRKVVIQVILWHWLSFECSVGILY